MSDTAQELEAKLLAILNDEQSVSTLADAVEASAAGENETLTDEQRALLATLVEGGLPTPEEIIQTAQIAEHNASVDQRRAVDLERRRARRESRSRAKRDRRR